MGITQWGERTSCEQCPCMDKESRSLFWGQEGSVHTREKAVSLSTEAERWVRCWELMEILFQLLQLNPFNLPLNRQADFAVIYLRIPLSELFFLVKTQRNSTQRRNMPLLLLPVHPRAPALLAPLLLLLGLLLPLSTGPGPPQDTGHLRHPPSCPSEECAVGRRCRLSSSPSEGICILISPALALPF